jgi:hypothetical protein
MSVLDYRGPERNSSGQVTVSAMEHSKARYGGGNKHSQAIREMLLGWALYAEAHEARFESGIGEDYVLGPYWANVGLAIKRLLDGETGGFDCGSLDHNITAMIEAQGFKTDGYELIESKD